MYDSNRLVNIIQAQIMESIGCTYSKYALHGDNPVTNTFPHIVLSQLWQLFSMRYDQIYFRANANTHRVNTQL